MHSPHPEHAQEQAYIERVRIADELTRERAERAAESAGDRYAARTARQQMLERFSDPVDLDSLCFGRIDLAGGKRHYLGRGQVRAEDNALLVVNWRMPVASAFYTASRQDRRGLHARRRFQLDGLRLLRIVEDDFVGRTRIADPASEPDAAAAETEDVPVEPHVVDAILADMDRARGAEMRDIVATIEARQYELISDDIDGVLVIQGGPGSGKTAIALHRAAWLLFNYKNVLERAGVLVVGPNRAFMEYVARVLPSLGESAVVQSAIDRLPNLEDVRVRGSESMDVARLKGDIRMAGVVRDAVRARVRPLDQDETLVVGRARVLLASARVLELITDGWKFATTYTAAREAFSRQLVGLAQAAVGDSRSLFQGGPNAVDVAAAVTGPGGPLERIWPTVTAPEVVRDLLSSRARMRAVGSAALAEPERELLRRGRQRLIREEPWTPADVPLLDEADVAIRGLSRTYGYVIADEAQDLSPMQLRMVYRRSGDGRATLVGDIAQSTSPTRLPDWTDLLEAADMADQARIAELGIGYRVPRQIMDLAATLLPRISPEIVQPRAVREGAEDPRLIHVERPELAAALTAEVEHRAEGERTLGVIAPAELNDDVRSALDQSGLVAGDILTDGLSRQVTVLNAEQAKGLEFDHVVVVDPAGMAGPSDDWAYVYIALTRATRTLSVLYTTLEPFALDPPVEPEPVEVEALAVEDLPQVAEPAGPELGARYTEALMQAKFLHDGQRRRGTSTPYLAHLQAVAALVLEDGGSEDEAIAALLHDAVEDNGTALLDRIGTQFGRNVARIVAGCTDPAPDGLVSWRDLKTEHIHNLERAGPEVRRVALAEKLDNVRALLRDYRRLGERLWVRMEVDSEEHLWYVSALADLFSTERPGDMAWEFQDTVERLMELASAPEPGA